MFTVTTVIGFGAGIYFGLPWLGALIGGIVVAGIIATWLAKIENIYQTYI